MIRLILIGTIFLLSLTFFLQNREEVVTLRYLFGFQTGSTEIYKPILISFVVGMLVASILLFPSWVQSRIQLRRKTKALQEAEADLERLRPTLPRGQRQPTRLETDEIPRD